MRHVLLLMGMWLCLTAGNCVQNYVVLFENPSEQYLNMAGGIEDGMKYIVTVMYGKNARESGCEDYNEDTGMCRVKPHGFTYVPHIDEKTHRVHIPLRELSPGVNSWWKPFDVSICVGPQSTDSEPHQCQRLFLFTKNEHDGNSVIDLVCSPTWWCSRKSSGRNFEHVSEFNREYVVNIFKEPSL